MHGDTRHCEDRRGRRGLGDLTPVFLANIWASGRLSASGITICQWSVETYNILAHTRCLAGPDRQAASRARPIQFKPATQMMHQLECGAPCTALSKPHQ